MGIQRISTGIPNLDDITNGGFPLGSVIMYSGSPGSQKFLSGLNFINNGLNNQENAVFITTKYTIPKIRQIAEYYNINYIDAIFIDAANWRIKRLDRNSKSPSKYEVNNITDLNSLLSLIIQACNDNQKITRVFFDTPSSLLLYSIPGTEQVFKFFDLLTTYTRNHKITFVYTVDTELHSNIIISTFHHFSDGNIIIKSSKDKNNINYEISYLWLTDTY